MSRSSTGGIFAAVGALIGGFMGYRQAIEAGFDPAWQGALILGALGFVVGGIGGILLRSAMSVLLYVILFGVLIYFFRGEIQAITGIDPVAAAQTAIEDILAFIREQIGGGNTGN